MRYVYRFDDGSFCTGSGNTTDSLDKAKIFKGKGHASNAANLCYWKKCAEISGSALPVSVEPVGW